MDALHARIQKLTQELIDLRRDFHAHPELGFEEFRTAEIVERYLQDLGLQAQRMATTGVVAVLDSGTPGPVLMLRADMDALPVTEDTGLPFCSTNPGVMHACGHDAHMAMLLGAAKVLVENKDRLKGRIKFVFQPNEENAGAVTMIQEGVLDNPKVDGVMGLHIWTPLESGKVAVSEGTVMAGLDVFKVTVQGRGGHTGFPHQAVDPVIAAANLIQTVQTIQTREISQFQPTIIMFGKIQGGTKGNIIPDSVELEGTIRYLYPAGPESEEQPTERFKRIVQSVCEVHRCGCEIVIEHENIPLVNDSAMAELARNVAVDVLGEPEVTSLQSIAGEDFSEFSARVPGVFLFLGAGNAAKGTTVAHHNPCFNIDEDVLPTGVALLVRGAFHFCNGQDNA